MIKLLFTHVMYFIFIISSLDHVCKGYKQEQDSSTNQYFGGWGVFWWVLEISCLVTYKMYTILYAIFN